MKSSFKVLSNKVALTAVVVAATTTFALAQQGTPGAEFIDKWDADSNGAVTLAEATERRGDIFLSFDQDDDGILTVEEYALFDEARALEHENDTSNNGAKNGGGHGNGGQGKGKGGGHGQGGGQSGGQGGGKNSEGMEFGYNDTNGDGTISREEFMSRTNDWFGMMDRNGDGAVTTQDFGRKG